MQKFHCVIATNGREHLDELFDRETVIEVVEQRLGGNTGALKYESSSHKFGIGMHRAMVKCKH